MNMNWRTFIQTNEIKQDAAASIISTPINQVEKEMTKFAQRSQHLLESEEWTDCSFISKIDGNDEKCQEKIIKAHKIFLAMSSPVFEAMFYGPVAEKKFPIELKDIHFCDFKKLLQYIYTGDIQLEHFEDACNISYAAMKYMLPTLKRICIDRIWDFLSSETVCHAYETAKLVEDRELEEQCLQMISFGTSQVIQASSFPKINVTTLEKILDMDYLSVASELELYHAVLKWAKSELRKQDPNEHSVTLRSITNTVLPKIRFLSLSPEDIAKNTASSELLTSEENYAILINLLSHNPCVPLPQNFSTNRCKRSKIIQMSNENCWHSCIKNVKIMTDHSTYTEVNFQVEKKIRIIGIKMNPEKLKLKSTLENNSRIPLLYFLGMWIELAIANGPLLSASHLVFRPDITGPMRFNSSCELQRNKQYVLRMSWNSYFEPHISTLISDEFKSADHYHFKDLAIKSIIFTTEEQYKRIYSNLEEFRTSLEKGVQQQTSEKTLKPITLRKVVPICN